MSPPPRTRAIAPGVGARALYLGSRERKRVSCTAEALVVTNARAQTLRYPVARVARVVSAADVVDWSGAALALCMRAGIPITWLDAHGQAIGSLYPSARNATPLATAVDSWLDTTEGLARYHNWLRSRRMNVLMRWGKEHADTITPQQWESTKREWVYGQTFQVHLPLALRHLCLAYVAAQLYQHGLSPTFWGPNPCSVDLDEHLCELLWAEINLCSGSLADKTAEGADLTALFERWNTHNASALALHLSSLRRNAMKELHT